MQRLGCPGAEEGVEIIVAIGAKKKCLWLVSSWKKPKGSNSMETKLSRVNWRPEIKIFTILGEIRKFCKNKGRGPTTRITT
jgi:hypothetical protein